MSLLGDGAIAIWHDVPLEIRADYYEWHNREHQLERVAIPGFRRGRRYIALAGEPDFFTLYETDGPQVQSGADYLLRLNNPTLWTRSVAPRLTQNIRSLCKVVVSLGPSQGGLLATLRYDVPEPRAEEQRRYLAHRVLPELADRPGIVGVHLCVADHAASMVQTEEKRNRPEAARVPGRIVLVEGAADRASLDAACDDLLNDRVLLAAGANTPIERGVYQLQNSRGKTAAG